MAKRSMKKQLRKNNVRMSMEKRKKKAKQLEDYCVGLIENEYYSNTVDASPEDYYLFNYQEEM